MGAEVLIPLALSAVSAGASYYNTQNTAKKQDNALAAQIRQQGQRQREADAKVSQEIQNRKASTPDDERKDIMGQFMQHIRAASDNSGAGLKQAGAVSDAYAKDASNAATGITDYGTKVADMLSRIDAPTAQRRGEAIGQQRTSNEIDLVRRMAGGDDFLARMRLQGIRRNPWLDAFAALSSQGAGMNWGGGATGASIGNDLNAVANANGGSVLSNRGGVTSSGYYVPPRWG